MKKWDSWICAVSSYNRVQGADRGQASASGEAAERVQIELDHKGPNMHWGPRYCQHSCPIQWALKGKSYFKTEFTCYSCYSIGYSREWASLTQICHHETQPTLCARLLLSSWDFILKTKVECVQCITLRWWMRDEMRWKYIDTAHTAKNTSQQSSSQVLTSIFLLISNTVSVCTISWWQCQLKVPCGFFL